MAEFTVGTVELNGPVLTAAGTGGLGAELSEYGDLSTLGGIVVKSLAAFEWAGNPAPRVGSWGESMINSVGLSGPGVATWRSEYLPELEKCNARTIASIWGRSVEEFSDAALALHGATISAIEVNASCPNLEGRTGIFAHSATLTSELVSAAKAAGFPVWIKLSPNTPDLIEIAAAALDAGADALVLTNTLLGMAIDISTRRPILGNHVGGVSGKGIFPIALRAVFECRAAFPQAPIVGVGGIASGEDAVAMVMAGADAVQVGTAIFENPRAPWRIQKELLMWLAKNGTTIPELKGAAHG
jgi:dihydroorotate dehydrogenase (NAD+) catalytic subunit